jgi:hypothetical protein
MAEVSSFSVIESAPNASVKRIFIETANDADATNTVTIDLAAYGIVKLLAISGWKHTTDNSVVVVESPTTAVTGTSLVITVPAGTDNDKRVYEIVGFGATSLSLT